MLELKDHATAAHTWRVVLYMRAVAEDLGLSHDEVERLGLAAALHDLGKIDVPDEVLRKPGPLTPDERLVMERHPLLGVEHLRAMGEDDPLLINVVRSHHERLDASGYPDALAGDAIPRAAQLFAVIDTFDAMTSWRPYRPVVPEDAVARALRELRSSRGLHYAPLAVDVFASLHDAGSLHWILHHFNDGATLPGYERLADVPAIAREAKSRS